MRQRTTPRLGVALGPVALGAVALALAGCGAETTDVSGEDTAQTCADIDRYTEALGDLARALDPDGEAPDGRAPEVQAALDQAEGAQRSLEESISEVAEERTDDVARAWDALETAFGGTGEDASFAQEAGSLRAEAQSVADAAAAVREDLDCD